MPAPELHVLGASVEGAAFAGEQGLGFAYAHHFARPHVIVATAVICGETDAHAEDLASSGDLGWLRFGQGLRDRPPDHGADLQG